MSYIGYPCRSRASLGSQKDEELGDAIQAYWTWTTYARTGDPNGGGLPMWPRYTSAMDDHIVLGNEISVGTEILRDPCDFWEAQLSQ